MTTKMTELAYIVATDLGKITSAVASIRDITPASNPIIHEDDYHTVMRIITSWLEQTHTDIDIASNRTTHEDEHK